MKITKDENGKLIIDGEGITILFPKEGEEWLKIEGFGDDPISQINNFTVDFVKAGGVDKMKLVTNYLLSLNRM